MAGAAAGTQAGTVGVGIEACGRPIVDLAIGRSTIDPVTVRGTVGLGTVQATTVQVGAVATGTVAAAAGTGGVRTYRASSPT
jgi:hypothetical protein